MEPANGSNQRQQITLNLAPVTLTYPLPLSVELHQQELKT